LIRTGEKDLDRIVQGFRYGQLVVVAGQRETGKTRLIVSIINSSLEEDSNIVHFSQHGAAGDFNDASAFSLDLDDEDAAYYYPFYVNSVSMSALTKVIETLNKDPGLDLLIIDTVFMINDAQNTEDRNWNVQKIKNIAKDQNFTVIVTVPLARRHFGLRQAPLPTIDDIKEVFYPGIADTVILLDDTGKKNEIGDRTIKGTVAKNNYGKTGEYEFVLLRSRL